MAGRQREPRDRALSRFDRLARQDEKLYDGADYSSHEWLVIVMTALLFAGVLLVTIPMVDWAKPVGKDAKSPFDLVGLAVVVLGFGSATWQLARAARIRKEDQDWKAIEIMSAKYEAFSSDAYVKSAKRMIEAMDGQYSAVIFTDARADKPEGWLDVERLVLRNGFTSDDKRELDGGFLEPHSGNWIVKARKHDADENSVAYCFDMFCTHLLSFDRVLDHKPWIMKDFYALVHYWAMKLCGLSEPDRACRALAAEGDELRLDRWLVGSVLISYGLPADGEGRERLQDWCDGFGENWETVRCHGLLAHYFAEYYGKSGSDDVVQLIAKVSMRNDAFRVLSESPLLVPREGLRAILLGGAPDEAPNEIAELRRQLEAEIDGWLPVSPDNMPEYAREREWIVGACREMLLAVAVACAAFEVSDRPGAENVYKKTILLAYWRCIFALGCNLRTGSKPEAGIRDFNERLRECLALLMEPQKIDARTIHLMCDDVLLTPDPISHAGGSSAGAERYPVFPML